jgi:hypothetical protein
VACRDLALAADSHAGTTKTNFSGNVFRGARVGGNMRIGSQEGAGGGNRETFLSAGRINHDAAFAEMGIDR